MVDAAKIYSILIGLYLAGMVVVGIIHAVRIRTAAEYLAAGRTVGFFRTVGTVVATFCGAAAIMSGADSYIMMATASISRDIYQRHFRPDASSRQILFFSRLGVVGFSCLGLIIALAAEGIIPLLMLSLKTAGAGLAIPFLALMFWKESTRAGIIWEMMATTICTSFSPILWQRFNPSYRMLNSKPRNC